VELYWNKYKKLKEFKKELKILLLVMALPAKIIR